MKLVSVFAQRAAQALVATQLDEDVQEYYCPTPKDTVDLLVNVVLRIGGTSSGKYNTTTNRKAVQKPTPTYKKLSAACDNEVLRARAGLKLHDPELCSEGIGGTYFLCDETGQRAWLYKPTDEEPGAKNHPKQAEIAQMAKRLEGTLPGEGALREVAAYALDHEHRARVPKTRLAHLMHSKFHSNDPAKPSKQICKYGSLQDFVPNIGEVGEMSTSGFTKDSVHNIAQLDIRMFNMDRNNENILVVEERGRKELIPIDHTYTLPDRLDMAWFDWLYWKQTSQPISASLKQYIEAIDIEKDAQILRSLGIREACIRTMKIGTTLLKTGVACGKNLFEIAMMQCREEPNEPSTLERLVASAEERGFDLKILALLITEEFSKKENCP